jgi:hypothetical protein
MLRLIRKHLAACKKTSESTRGGNRLQQFLTHLLTILFFGKPLFLPQ